MTSQAIVIKPTPKQIEAHKLLEQNTIVLYGGAIRGAKSYWGCLEIISFCFKYPNSRWLMLRESWSNIEGKLLVTFKENFLDKGFQQHVKEFNRNTYTLTWDNGSQIVFMAESYNTDKDLNRFRGLEINGAFIDEINEIQEATFNKIIERSGSWFHSPNCPTKILASCNPSLNWVKERFYDKWKTNTLPNNTAYIQAKITDNPYIPKEYMDSLKLLPRYQYEVFVEGNWDISLKQGGEFYKCFELDKHVKEGIDYNPDLPLHISWDENVNPYLPCGIFQIVDKTIYMIDEIAGKNPNNTIKSVCSVIKRKYQGHVSGMFIYGDSTSQKDDVKLEKGHNFFRLIMQELAEFKPSLRITPANPSVVMRGNFINTILENNRYDIHIIISDKCKLTINDFINTKEAADGTKNKEKETDPTSKVSYQKWGHFTDLFDYFITFAFRKEYAMYQTGASSFKNVRTGPRVSKNGW